MKNRFSRNLLVLLAGVLALGTAMWSPRASAQTLCDDCFSGSLSCNNTVIGELDDFDCQFIDGPFVDAYSFTLPASGTITFTMRSTEIDCFLYLLNDACNFITQNDDCVPGATTDSCITRSLAAGTYYLAATSFEADEIGVYTLSVTCPITQPTLSIARLPNGDVQVSTTAAGTLHCTAEFRGVNTVWTPVGAISPGSPYVTTPGPGAPIRFYRQSIP